MNISKYDVRLQKGHVLECTFEKEVKTYIYDPPTPPPKKDRRLEIQQLNNSNRCFTCNIPS